MSRRHRLDARGNELKAPSLLIPVAGTTVIVAAVVAGMFAFGGAVVAQPELPPAAVEVPVYTCTTVGSVR